MQIQINTDRNIEGREALATHVRGVVESALAHVKERITRVEVHLGDENGHAFGVPERRCMMEVRLAGQQPCVVTHHAVELNDAIEGAASKLRASVESTLGRLGAREPGRRA